MPYSSCWSDILRSNYLSGNLVLFVDLRTGGYADLSSYARTVTLATAGSAAQQKRVTAGKALDMNGPGSGAVGAGAYLSIADAAALNLNPSGTVFVALRTEVGLGNGSAARLAQKRGAGGTAWDLYESAANTLAIYDGTVLHGIGTNLSWPTARTITAAFTNGSVPLGYENGIQLALPVEQAAWVSANAAEPVTLANYYTGAQARAGVSWLAFALFSALLTPQEIAQLHADWMTSTKVL